MSRVLGRGCCGPENSPEPVALVVLRVLQRPAGFQMTAVSRCGLGSPDWHDVGHDGLAHFLGGHPPFDALDARELDKLSTPAVVADFEAAEQILDAFQSPSREMFVVLSGQVELWNSAPSIGDEADENLGPGSVFGFAALLRNEPVGPLAIALGPVRVARIPADAVSLPSPRLPVSGSSCRTCPTSVDRGSVTGSSRSA